MTNSNQGSEVPNRSFNSSIEQLLSQSPDQWRQDRMRELQTQGYEFGGGGMAKRYNQHGRLSIPEYTPSDLLIGQPNQPGDPLLRGALLEDTQKMQGAADRQYMRNQQQISGLDQFIGRSGGEMRQVGQQGAGQLNRAAGYAQGLGNQQMGNMEALLGKMWGQTNEDVNGIMKGIGGVQDRIKGTIDKQMPGYYKGLDNARDDVDEAYRLGDEAVAGFDDYLKKREDRTAQDASITAAAISRSALSQKSALVTAMKTGQIDESTYQSNLAQLEGQVGEQTQTQITGIFSDFQKSMDGLQQAFAGLRMSNAGMRLQGSQLKSGIEGQRLQGMGMELSASNMLLEGEQLKLGAAGLRQKSNMDIASQYAQAQEGQRQMAQLSSGLQQASVATQQAAILNAVNMEMQGRLNMASLVQQNPETVVSWFQGLLALYGAAAAMSPVGGGGGGGDGKSKTTASAEDGMGQQLAQSQSAAQFGQPGYRNPNSNYTRSTSSVSGKSGAGKSGAGPRAGQGDAYQKSGSRQLLA